MKKIRKFYQTLEKKPPRLIAGIAFTAFLIFFLVGIILGLEFRRLRLNQLLVQQRSQRAEETKRLEILFEKYSEAQVLKPIR